MVARVNSFTDETVYYYQYKNPFFYGEMLGREYYGSGSGDPLARTPKPKPVNWFFKDLDGNMLECGPASEYSRAAQHKEEYNKLTTGESE